MATPRERSLAGATPRGGAAHTQAVTPDGRGDAEPAGLNKHQHADGHERHLVVGTQDSHSLRHSL